MIDRRRFIKLVGWTAGLVFMGGYARQLIELPGSQEEIPASHGKVTYAMVIDVKACIGCRRCVYACIKENNIGRASGIAWIRVLAMKHGSIDLDDSEHNYTEAPIPTRWYLPVQCMQCGNPPCVHVCPVKATWKDPDGIIVIDYDRCIGCRYCMAACPYWARHFNWKEPYVPPEEMTPEGGTYGLPFSTSPIRPIGVVEKCTFCAHRTRKGIEPKCVEVCPVGARHFGDLNDPDSIVSKLIRSRQGFRLKEELGTEPHIYYVG